MFGFLRKIFKKKKTSSHNEKKNSSDINISEWSYQRFARFFGERVFPDPNFNEKIETIKDCINNKHLDRLDEIASLSGCSINEVIMKIRYLRNKRVFDDIYIDRYNKLVRKCNEEDEKILNTYRDMIYVNNYSIREIAEKVPNYYNKPLTIIEEDVYKDIKFLYDKCIINGIRLDDEKKEIIYYAIEKKKTEEKYATLNCPRCGSLVDVLKHNSAHCDYCGSVVEDKH